MGLRSDAPSLNPVRHGCQPLTGLQACRGPAEDAATSFRKSASIERRRRASGRAPASSLNVEPQHRASASTPHARYASEPGSTHT